jgi:hypothetical protein
MSSSSSATGHIGGSFWIAKIVRGELWGCVSMSPACPGIRKRYKDGRRECFFLKSTHSIHKPKQHTRIRPTQRHLAHPLAMEHLHLCRSIERLLLVRHAPGASAPPPAVPDSEALQDGNDEGRTTTRSSSVARAHTQSRAHRSSAHVHQLRAPRTRARKVSVPTMPVPVVGIGAHPTATRIRSPGAQGAALVRVRSTRSGRWSASGMARARLRVSMSMSMRRERARAQIPEVCSPGNGRSGTDRGPRVVRLQIK